MDSKCDLTVDSVFSINSWLNLLQIDNVMLMKPHTLTEADTSEQDDIIGGKRGLPWRDEDTQFIDTLKCHCERCGKYVAPWRWSDFIGLCDDCNDELKIEYNETFNFHYKKPIEDAKNWLFI